MLVLSGGVAVTLSVTGRCGRALPELGATLSHGTGFSTFQATSVSDPLTNGTFATSVAPTVTLSDTLPSSGMYLWLRLSTLASGGTKLNTFGTLALTETGKAFPDVTSTMVRVPLACSPAASFASSTAGSCADCSASA